MISDLEVPENVLRCKTKNCGYRLRLTNSMVKAGATLVWCPLCGYVKDKTAYAPAKHIKSQKATGFLVNIKNRKVINRAKV